ncbi:unnamed protein product [Euphydryas editha]|uniref:Uncharacterized protein n=1 Tax=Euphydryas editha TaxID=104508 RepID=A0AAU9UXB0_EUPED|nr:unnamed protein product [Euphydryas editha]
MAIMRQELALNNDNWGVIESAAPILKLFYDITVETSAEKNVSLAEVIRLCGIMKNHAVATLKRKVGKGIQKTIMTLPSTSEPLTSTSTTMTSIWDQFHKEVAKLTPTIPLAAGIVELDKYLQEPLLQRCNDPLRW